MKHILLKVLKRIWHDVVIVLGFTLLRPLAMSCRQTTLVTDAYRTEATGIARLKYRLHLSICKGCVTYLKMNEFLEAKYRETQMKALTPVELADFNQQLIRKLKAE